MEQPIPKPTIEGQARSMETREVSVEKAAMLLKMAVDTNIPLVLDQNTVDALGPLMVGYTLQVDQIEGTALFTVKCKKGDQTSTAA